MGESKQTFHTIIAIGILLIGAVVIPADGFSLELDALYRGMAEDLKKGQPIIATSYIGLWYDHNDNPERNLYWGNMGGHYFLFKNSGSLETLPNRYRNGALQQVAGNIRTAVIDNLAHYKWSRAFYRESKSDPKRVAVFKIVIEPGKFRTNHGARDAITIYNVMLAYSDMEECMKDMVLHLKQDRAREIRLQGTTLNLGAESRIMGYIGHNIYYGGACGIDSLESIPYTSKMKKGLFILGCQSARWCKNKFESPLVANLLLTRTNMAPEGYIMLALLDGVARGTRERDLVSICNRVYGTAQGAGKGVRLFTTEWLN